MSRINIIEIDRCIERYETLLIENPKYVVCGSLLLDGKWRGGILVYVKYKFWGEIICKTIKKYGGNYTVERTQFHKDGESYFDKCAEIFDSILLKVYGYKQIYESYIDPSC